MCKCSPEILKSEKLRFANQVVVELPYSQKDKARRLGDGLSAFVCIDPCILDEIKVLWDKGIQTGGCCCGHNNPDWYPFVNVAKESIQAMLDMGYVQEHLMPGRKDTFRLKSV